MGGFKQKERTESTLRMGGSPSLLSLLTMRLSLQWMMIFILGILALSGLVSLLPSRRITNTSTMVDTPQNVSQAKDDIQSTEYEGVPVVSSEPVSQSQNSSQSSVTVNGETVTAPSNGSVHRTVIQNGQTTQIDMENRSTQTTTATGASNSSSSSVNVSSNSNQSQTSITNTQTVP